MYSLGSSNNEQSIKSAVFNSIRSVTGVETMILDDKLSVLSNSHRRRLLRTLIDDSAPNTPTVSPNAVETDGGDREYAIVLHHVHLPQLEDHGIITWNQATGEVTKGPQFDEIEPLLAAVTKNHSTQPAGEPPD